ncbi:MAG: nicotinamide mononucleotide transporter [Flavobacteriales bacterium]|nr:nicotinamide mononucleotide transporter [Flavobacteriales bacterium]
MFWEEISIFLTSSSAEWTALVLNLLFVVLLIFERIEAWFFGVMASLLSVFIFIEAKLNSEALLYSVYVILGIYAWLTWKTNSKKQPMPIKKITPKLLLTTFGIGLSVWLFLGWFTSHYTNSELPWADAFSTSFAFVATYLEARKILESWLWWVVLNIFSVWLYTQRDLTIMAWMMAGFAVFSIVGFIAWQRKLTTQTG